MATSAALISGLLALRGTRAHLAHRVHDDDATREPSPTAADDRDWMATRSRPILGSSHEVSRVVRQRGELPPAQTASRASTEKADDDEPRAEGAVAGQVSNASELASAWRREPRDPVGSRKVESYVREMAQTAHLDPSLVKDTDCGTSVCRVTLAFARAEDAFAFQQAQTPDFRYAIMTPQNSAAETSEARAAREPATEPAPSAPPTPAQSPEPASAAAQPVANGSNSAAASATEIEILLARTGLHEAGPFMSP